MERTHIIKETSFADNEENGLELFRASDGMQVGVQHRCTVIWGEEVNRRTSRNFINREKAKMFLAEFVASEDAKKHDLGPVEIERQAGSAILIAGSFELPGAIRKM